MVDRRLITWTFATFNTVLFVLGFVIPSYASGGLSDVLPSLSTSIGVVIFLYLWTLVWVATRLLFTQINLITDSVRTILIWATTLGAVVGIAFLLGTVLGAGIPSALSSESLELITVVLVSAIGAPIAAVVGGVVGLLAGILDMAVLTVAERIRPTSRRDRL